MAEKAANAMWSIWMAPPGVAAGGVVGYSLFVQPVGCGSGERVGTICLGGVPTSRVGLPVVEANPLLDLLIAGVLGSVFYVLAWLTVLALAHLGSHLGWWT